MIKHLTSSEEAAKLEKDPEYVSANIVTEGGLKYGVFEKVKKEEIKEEKKKNEK